MSEITILPGELNITIYKGDTFSKVFTLTDNEGNPVDLTECSVAMQVRKKPGGEVLVNLSEGNGLTVVDNTVTASFNVEIPKGGYRWDMQFTYNGDIVRTYINGDFFVEDDITRL